eukprot:TRINITY_DN7070_c1_g1_i1.p2 TRINITY_DN7070_c1_g1~~TRINITY_DN7070_c1_g1_i1.p2  ORF type:complete len:478 (+),score=82.02 TRINITY_DN7070_c1_g1_i1:42-1436(+)
MEISVRMLDGELLPVEIGEQWDEKRLKQEVGCDTEEHKVEFEGEVLKDGQIISDLGLQEGDVITITASQEVQEKVRFEMSGLPTGFDGLARMRQALREDDVGTFMAYYSMKHYRTTTHTQFFSQQLRNSDCFQLAVSGGSFTVAEALFNNYIEECAKEHRALDEVIIADRYYWVIPLLNAGASISYSVYPTVLEKFSNGRIPEAAMKEILGAMMVCKPVHMHERSTSDNLLHHIATNPALQPILDGAFRNFAVTPTPLLHVARTDVDVLDRILAHRNIGVSHQLHGDARLSLMYFFDKWWDRSADDSVVTLLARYTTVLSRKMKKNILRKLTAIHKLEVAVKLIAADPSYSWVVICTALPPAFLQRVLTANVPITHAILRALCEDTRQGFPMNASLEIILKHDPSLGKMTFSAGGSPLSVLVSRNNIEGVKLFLEHGADLHHKTRFGNSCAQAVVHALCNSRAT